MHLHFSHPAGEWENTAMCKLFCKTVRELNLHNVIIYRDNVVLELSSL